jgi:hypothetical protein
MGWTEEDLNKNSTVFLELLSNQIEEDNKQQQWQKKI